MSRKGLLLRCALAASGALLLALPAVAGASGTINFRSSTFQAPEIEGKVTVVVDREGSVGTASVTLTTIDGTAKAPADYVADVEDLSFMPNETTKTVELFVVDDGVREANETFKIELSAPDDTTILGANKTASVLIVDSPGKASFARDAFTVAEGAGEAIVAVMRTKGASGPLTVNYATSNGFARAGGGGDYTAATGKLTWTDGDTSPRTFAVPITQDAAIEAPETISLTLTPDTSLPGALAPPSFSERPTAVLTIDDDDTSAIQRLRGSDIFTMPSTGKCVRGRKLTVVPRNRKDVKLVRVEMKVAGKRVRRATSQKSIARRAVLRRLPASGRYEVEAAALTSTGRLISIVRQYRACSR